MDYIQLNWLLVGLQALPFCTLGNLAVLVGQVLWRRQEILTLAEINLSVISDSVGEKANVQYGWVSLLISTILIGR